MGVTREVKCDVCGQTVPIDRRNQITRSIQMNQLVGVGGVLEVPFIISLSSKRILCETHFTIAIAMAVQAFANELPPL